jgi:DNA glycosylase AlkZ-like
MPRAALLSIHARVEGTKPETWDDPALVQVWGPRFSAYVVAERDLAIFTLGRLPAGGAKREQGEELATRLRDLLDGERMSYAEAGRALGVHPNQLRYAAPTGTILMRWEGARRPEIWTVPAPDVDPEEARLELARRYLHVFGPSTPDSFRRWAGIGRRNGPAAFDALELELTAVRTPIGEAWILSADEPAFLADAAAPAPARLLPSGDAYYLLHGADRELLVPDAGRRDALWTSRVWPGAVLVDGEVVGTWRRAHEQMTVATWHRLSGAQRDAVEGEAVALPLPGVGPVVVEWE